VRPVRWIVALLDDEVIPVEFAGIRAGNQSRGHRILGPKSVTISAPTKYIETLRGAHIAASAAEREQLIRKALDAVTRAVPGARWREDAELLKTVVNLTEWPSAILGNFDPQFLSLPEEVLVTVMRDHQKYFAVEDANGKLAPHFLAVLNTDGDPDGLIRHGNERVLRARFSDAQFFWNTDQKIPLVDRVEMLKAVTFQKDLGSYDEKAQRVGRLAAKVADATEEVNLSALLQAVRLAKTDLTTELVRDFTELQGIVGGLYAQAQGLPQAVADAVYDHYKPESMEDSVPRTLEGAVLSVADKADSIAGMFGLGLAPSGSKDPFALRRQANGIIKILAEHRIRLSLADLVLDSFECYKNTDAEARFKFPTTGLFKIRVEIQGTRSTQEKLVHIPELLAQNELIRQTWDFLGERVAFFLKDIQKYPAKVVKSVVTVSFDDVFDSLKRASAAKTISESREFEPVFSAFKRMKNIVRQAKERGEFLSDQTEFDPNMFQEDAETHLWETVQEIGNRFGDYRKGGQYVGAFRLLGELRKPIDEFFENVRVMTDDPEMRKNRLCLLENLVDNFNTIVDLSELAPEFAT
jgi:glycyl-tRNA synthetase beta chain